MSTTHGQNPDRVVSAPVDDIVELGGVPGGGLTVVHATAGGPPPVLMAWAVDAAALRRPEPTPPPPLPTNLSRSDVA